MELDAATEREERFERYHRLNRHVAREMAERALEVRRAGRKCGMQTLIERLRWSYLIDTTRVDEFKISNDLEPYYARLIMLHVPELRGFFDLRRMQKEPPWWDYSILEESK
jgi:hypothetical protein